jgi:formylglycine-generating enzyme required for sulfatase activity
MKRILGIAVVIGLVGYLSLLAHGVEPGKVEVVDLGKDVKFEMVLIPAGNFMRGSPGSEKGRRYGEAQHKVTLTKSFFIGKYEVTQELWEGVMGNNPSYTKGATLPVTDVSWEDCQKFIKKLNAKTDGSYRLPTDAEWEYACRAGTKTAFSFGDKITPRDANYNESGDPLRPKSVGTYNPNAFGLYDMHGNVSEWCNDWHGIFDDIYLDTEVTDPKGAAAGKYRVVRNGNCFFNDMRLRSAYREPLMPTDSLPNIGFRLARTK